MDNKIKIERIEQLIFNKYGRNDDASDLIGFFFLWVKLGQEVLKEFYSEKTLKNRIKALENAGIFEFLRDEETKSVHKLEKVNYLNIEWMRYFVIFAQTENSAEAARILHITPQALSKAIAGLESILKIKLVERKKHFSGLTVAGKVFYKKAVIVLQKLNDIEKYFNDLSLEDFSGGVNFGWTNLLNHSLLNGVVSDFIQSFPYAIPKIYTMFSDDIEKDVILGNLDAGITTKLPYTGQLDHIELKKSACIIVGKPRTATNWKELSYITIRQNNNNKEYTEVFDDKRFKCKIATEVDSFELAVKMAENGVGALYIPEILITEQLTKGTLKIISEAPVENFLTLYLIWNHDSYLSSFATEFISKIEYFFTKSI